MADKWKQIAMGTVISIAGVLGLTSCENKNENQEENKKPQTELSTNNFENWTAEKSGKSDGRESDGRK